MGIFFVLLFAVSTAANALPYLHDISSTDSPNNDAVALISPSVAYLSPRYARFFSIKNMLQKQEPLLRPEVINKVLTSLACARSSNTDFKPVLTIIDYSMPSNQKRMWVFDLTKMKLLYHTYVSHGITSGTLRSISFSNRNNSKASSIGVYLTGASYYGRAGISMYLQGLDQGFNDNASRRYIVMHGGWYMDESFIKKYGRPGRSWGCPALAKHEIKHVVNTIKDRTFLVIYYPSDDWFNQSKFLNCKIPAGLSVPNSKKIVSQLPIIRLDNRAPILFSDSNNNDRREQNEPIIVIKADAYIKIFQAKAPLKRMLRRRIDNYEYIALSPDELKFYIEKEKMSNANLSDIYLVIPKVVKKRGVWRTLMQVLHRGKITDIKKLSDASADNFLIQLDKNSNLRFKPTHRFIRWLGL